MKTAMVSLLRLHRERGQFAQPDFPAPTTLRGGEAPRLDH